MSSWKQAVWVAKQIKDAVHFTEKYNELEEEIAEYNNDLDFIEENLNELRQLISQYQEQDVESLNQLSQQVEEFTQSDFWTTIVPEENFNIENEESNPFLIIDKNGEYHNFYLPTILAKNGATVFLSDNANSSQSLTEKIAKKYNIQLPE